MSEGRMPQIMPQGNGLNQIIIQPQGLRNGSGSLRNFQGMGQTVPVVVALRRQKDLGLILQSPKGLTVQDPVTVPLVDCPDITLLLITIPSPAVPAVGSVRA